MGYDLSWKYKAEEDFDRLDTTIQKQAYTQFKKLSKSPELGLPLGKKVGLDLTAYRKLYFFRKKHRIVYKLDQEDRVVTVFAIRKREDMKVYREVIRRLEFKS